MQSRNIRTKFNLDKYCKAQTCPLALTCLITPSSCLFLASPRSLIILDEFSAYLQTPLKQRLYTHVSASVCVCVRECGAVCLWLSAVRVLFKFPNLVCQQRQRQLPERARSRHGREEFEGGRWAERGMRRRRGSCYSTQHKFLAREQKIVEFYLLITILNENRLVSPRALFPSLAF